MRALGLGTFVIVLLAISALLDRDSGMGIWLELRGDLADARVRLAALADENEALRREIEILEAEPSAIDRAIREELDLVAPGEVVVRFVGAASPRPSDGPGGPEGWQNHSAGQGGPEGWQTGSAGQVATEWETR